MRITELESYRNDFSKAQGKSAKYQAAVKLEASEYVYCERDKSHAFSLFHPSWSPIKMRSSIERVVWPSTISKQRFINKTWIPHSSVSR